MKRQIFSSYIPLNSAIALFLLFTTIVPVKGDDFGETVVIAPSGLILRERANRKSKAITKLNYLERISLLEAPKRSDIVIERMRRGWN